MMMSDQHNTAMQPRIESCMQVIRGLKAEVVANCDRLQNLTAPSKPGWRPIATNMSYLARFPDAFPVVAMVSTLSRHLRWNHVDNPQQISKHFKKFISKK